MSDGERPAVGWWKASDGNWYPPETHPDYTAVELPPAVHPAPRIEPAAPHPSSPPLPSDIARAATGHNTAS